jgi:hypothetical protein
MGVGEIRLVAERFSPSRCHERRLARDGITQRGLKSEPQGGSLGYQEVGLAPGVVGARFGHESEQLPFVARRFAIRTWLPAL